MFSYYAIRIISTALFLFPNKLSYKITRPQYLITQ